MTIKKQKQGCSEL